MVETVALSNPVKAKLRRISKSILNRINTSLQNLINVNQWKGTSEVNRQFKIIRNKQKHKSNLFDIKYFYPTIKKDLLTKSLKIVEEKVQIPDDDKKY